MKSEIILDGVTLSCTESAAAQNGSELPLSRMERKLLFYFLQHPGAVATREQLLREVWEYEAAGNTRTVDSHVKKLRAHLGALSDCLVTVRGVGYRLDAKAIRPRKGV